MLVWAKENLRVVRALCALSGVVALGVTFAVMISKHGEQDAEFIRQINRMLWGVSELNYTSQLLAKSFVELSVDPSRLEETRVAFDVVWSRMDIIRREELQVMNGFEEVFQAYEAFLAEVDPILFGSAAISPQTLRAFETRLTDIARLSRQTWLDGFGTRGSPEQVRMALSPTHSAYTLSEITVGVLVMLLIVFVFVEIWLSGREQRREAALRREASQASEAKSAFIAAVSHEVRTPLNGILATADLLIDTPLTQDQTRYVTVVRDSGGALLHMLNEVLDFSKMDAGQFSVSANPFDVETLLNDVIALYTPVAQQKSIRLVRWHDFDGALTLQGDARRLKQVLNNLVANAIKFTLEGSVTLSAWFVAEDSIGGQKGLYLSVADTGCGIARDDLTRIFEPFGQSSMGLERNHEGTGLGLTISNNLCSAMGGTLTVASEVGVGTAFDIFLPFAIARPAEDTASAEAVEPDLDLCLQDILIVDDNQTNRFVLRKLLAKLNGLPREAKSGEEALAQAALQMPSLVLMDVQMPGMDGVTATAEILAAARDAALDLPCIIGVTANTEPEQVMRYKAAGMEDVLPKPVRKADLVQVLSKSQALRSPKAA